MCFNLSYLMCSVDEHFIFACMKTINLKVNVLCLCEHHAHENHKWLND